MSYFLEYSANILNNNNLREPQVYAYAKAFEYYNNTPEDRTSVIVLPTGTGKTGLITLLPFGISEGKVLVITPQLTIKDGVLKSLSDGPDNFLLKQKVVESPLSLPQVIEYSKETRNTIDEADIVVLNVHKLQSRLEHTLLNIVDENYFDMIIIDEAHHSTAKTWIEAINYFKNAKVIKLTGTPFRSDNEKIRGKEIFHYTLGAAMSKGYVKSLEKFKYIPEELYFTLDEDESKRYSIQEIKNKNLKDDDWIKRSVAYSRECSERVVDESIKLLKEKKENNNIPHKIIAVACSIHHAKQIKELYEEKGYNVAILHSQLSEFDKETNFSNIENHRVEVVINVAMLGEGYDHKYLSVAAIFRPFKSLLPYAQFIGRILRYIPEQNSPIDNIGNIIAHEHLDLDKLWDYYKTEIEKSKIISSLDEDFNFDDDDDIILGTSERLRPANPLGTIEETGSGRIEKENYLSTEIIKKKEETDKEMNEKIDQLVKLLGSSREEAKRILNQQNNRASGYNRPDLLYKQNRSSFNQEIRMNIVPELLLKYNIPDKGNELKSCKLFKNRRYSFIAKKNVANNAMLVIYFNTVLMNKLGKKRDDWTPSDINNAEIYLQEQVEYVKLVLENIDI